MRGGKIGERLTHASSAPLTDHTSDRHQRLPLRSARSVAARFQREYQWFAETVLSEGNRFVGHSQTHLYYIKWRVSSTNSHARPCNLKLQQRDLTPVLHQSVELAPQIGHHGRVFLTHNNRTGPAYSGPIKAPSTHGPKRTP